MNINDTSLLYKLFNAICNNNDVENLGEDLKLVFSNGFGLSGLDILYYDKSVGKLKNVLKDFELAEDYFSLEKLNILNNVFNKLKETKFVINDDIDLPDDIFDDDDLMIKSLSIGLNYENDIVGMVRFKFKNKTELSKNNLTEFDMFCSCLSLKVINIVLSKQIDISSAFYKSTKGIAKIIETQYDFQYIIPIIGEMIDKFVINHLIYIFIKQDDKYTLYWPSACWNKRVYELIETLSPDDDIRISDDKKTGAFALVSEGEVIGCVVAHSTIDKLTPEEIGYLSELTKQSSVTIERANTYSEILQNATMDALTGLNNRRQFEVRLKEQYSVANRQNTPLCAIMLDIDFFKKFNDTYGHAVGDRVLKTTANVIKSQLREYDIPSRYGGEEFCILLPQTDIEEALVVAERLRSAVESVKIDINENEQVNLTISVGLAQLDIKDMPEDLYMKADRALYEAKEYGRNKVVVFSKS